ncbi:branched-chain amino acid aminotransferase II [Cylindrobasidium torrendii FP15055 ss-10]|uniref:Branched-chain-amino-acid aminotransferase n=1 Tax=Cylindrobasidium torrendii FP15055 ss-10 TaxID=1314674 RepID=A0A0D7BEP4_9AGAR|nr:branched-chain amino acid aminotransferase II [Cylindrobasidium torrendii FP15055 ss-10]
MALWTSTGGKFLKGAAGVPDVPDLDASKVTITETKDLKTLPDPETLVFGATTSDYMLTCAFDPATGWGTPEIKPYAPIPVDPMSSALQYATNIFEGMKAYLGPDGEPRLFRPDMNMARLARSANRVALPPFNTEELVKLIKTLVNLEKRWIPTLEGYTLYIRPTIIGTRAGFGVAASDSSLLYIILAPSGPYFRTGGSKPLSLMTVEDCVRAWPGGTGDHKLGMNYSPGFNATRLAVQKGYDQILWMLGDVITEAGAMNFFVVLKSESGEGWDVVTPMLDGTILPGVTRASCLELAAAHGEKPIFDDLPPLRAVERKLRKGDVKQWLAEGRFLEAFVCGTAVALAPVGRIGFDGEDVVFPKFEGGLGPVGGAFRRRILDIQYGRVPFSNWSVPCQ